MVSGGWKTDIIIWTFSTDPKTKFKIWIRRVAHSTATGARWTDSVRKIRRTAFWSDVGMYTAMKDSPEKVKVKETTGSLMTCDDRCSNLRRRREEGNGENRFNGDRKYIL